MIPEDVFPYLNKMARAVISGEHNGIHDFEFGLDLILEGLEKRLPIG